MLARLSVSAPLIGMMYFALAAISLHFSRFGGGIATIWIATGILAGRLATLPPRQWPRFLVACGVASIVATGLFGLGWIAAPLLAVVNMMEAVLAGLVGRRISSNYFAGESFEWVALSYLGVCIAPSAVSAFAAVAVGAMIGLDDLGYNGTYWLVGHAVGMLTFMPIAAVVFTRLDTGSVVFPRPGKRLTACGILIGAMASTAWVFTGQNTSLLIFPILLAVLGAVFAGGGVALFLPVILAAIGGALTFKGFGPIAGMLPQPGDRVLFFEMYLAVTVLGVLPIVCEQSRRRRETDDLRKSVSRYRMMSDNTTDVIVHVGPDETIRFASLSALRAWGFQPGALVGRPILDLVATPHRDRLRRAHEKACSMQGKSVRVEFEICMVNGARRWFESHLRAVADETGGPSGYICAMRDIARRKQLEEDLSRAAMTDPLTGLANRRAFFDSAARFTMSAGATCIAVVDIDHFKQVNDRFGHAAGDTVLLAFSRLAQETLRSTDVIARIGGEEFAILLPHTTIDQATEVCMRLREQVGRRAVDTDAGTITVTISTGIAPLHEDPVEALARADSALYRAKAEGRDRLSVAA